MALRRRASSLSLIAVAAACAVALVVPACAGGTGSGGSTPRASGSLLPPTPTALPPFDAKEFTALLSQLHGKPVVVNIWASWCGPCVQEAPVLAEEAKAYGTRVQFVGIDIADQLTPARAFIQKYGWSYPSVFDTSGAIRDSLGLIGQPHTLVFDAKGRQTFVYSGPVPKASLDQAIRSALAATTPTPSPSGY